MSVTAEDRAILRRMMLNSGYLPETAAYEMEWRLGRDRAEMDAAAAEIWSEVRGMPRPSAPLPSLSSALAMRGAIFGAHEAEVAA